MTVGVLRRDLGPFAVIQNSFANVDGDFNLGTELPPGFGDCEVLEVYVFANSIATMMANPEFHGPQADVMSDGGSTRVQMIGTALWVVGGAGTLQAWIRRDALDVRAVWTQGMTIRALGEEVDVNAVPTVDFDVFITVNRLRNLVAPASTQPVMFTS